MWDNTLPGRRCRFVVAAVIVLGMWMNGAATPARLFRRPGTILVSIVFLHAHVRGLAAALYELGTYLVGLG